MATSSSSPSTLSSLVKCGATIANLLHEKAQIREGHIRRSIGSRIKTEIPISVDFHDQVRHSIDELLKDLKGAEGSIVQESISNVVDIIEGLVQKLVEFDKAHAKSYDELLEDIQKKFKSQFSITPSPDSSKHVDTVSSTTHRQLEECDDNESGLIKYKDLGVEERRCLFYLSLFPDGAELKKRELIYWWLGMMSLTWHSEGGEAEGERILAKFVAEGFIESVSNRYRMRTNVRSMVMEQAAENFSARYVEEGDLSIQQGHFGTLYVDDSESDTSQVRVSKPKLGSNNIVALLNIGAHTFNVKTLDWISKIKNALVLQLGHLKLDHDTGYIVVEDIEPLQKALKMLGEGEVRFLSLNGISGIVELPDSVCKLQNLVVLDLRACHNLESLPKGIGSLQELMHLDMSECYLLEHIPKGISSLSKLRVLKGFVVNPDSVSDTESSCDFSDLSLLKQLRKLSVRTRRIDFPTRKEDLDTLSKLEELITLRIAWVERSPDAQTDNGIGNFPVSLKKLELQAVPETTLSRLPNLISESNLEKLYIRGVLGTLDLNSLHSLSVKHVRLRYLPQLKHIERGLFMKSFPNLTKLHVFGCPNLTNCPCVENGVWGYKS